MGAAVPKTNKKYVLFRNFNIVCTSTIYPCVRYPRYVPLKSTEYFGLDLFHVNNRSQKDHISPYNNRQNYLSVEFQQ